MRFCALSERVDPTHEIAAALPWVHAASEPYVDWLLGGRRAARRILEQWMRRPSSEVYVGRVVVAEDPHPVGGYIAISGAELAPCRMQDAMAAAAAAPAERRPALVARLRCARDLLPEVGADTLYLSRMGVVAAARRRGYGRAIVDEYLRQGMRSGFRRFALDVCAANVAAIELYRSIGFRAERRRHVADLGMTYVRMALGSHERVAPPLAFQAGHERALGVDDAQQLRIARVDEDSAAVP